MFGLLLLAALGCDRAPTPLPTEVAVAAVRATDPTLAALLYAAPSLPADSPLASQARLVAWLRYVGFDGGQLQRLDDLRQAAVAQRQRAAEAEAAIRAPWAAKEADVYGRLLPLLVADNGVEGPQVVSIQAELAALSANGARERALLTVRLESTRRVLEAGQALLGTLDADQEARFDSALFVLRRRLDPVGTPGDYDALVGAPFSPGENGLLLRGSAQGLGDPMDLGGLFTDTPSGSEARARALPELRREAILFLVLHEPELGAALGLLENATLGVDDK